MAEHQVGDIVQGIDVYTKVWSDYVVVGEFRPNGYKIARLDTPGPAAMVYPPMLRCGTGKAKKFHRYGLQFRPCSIGAQPRGFNIRPDLLNKEPDHSNPRHRYGFMDYEVKLSEQDEKSYELNYIGEVWVRDDAE